MAICSFYHPLNIPFHVATFDHIFANRYIHSIFPTCTQRMLVSTQQGFTTRNQSGCFSFLEGLHIKNVQKKFHPNLNFECKEILF
ncbi:unnamed protein product, partial [Allacma fusca]